METGVFFWIQLLCIYVVECVTFFFPIRRKSLHGKNVLITGAARGIGRELALSFGRHGCRLFLVDLHLEDLQRLKNDLDGCGITSDVYNVDLSDKQAVERFSEKLKNEGLHCLIHNAEAEDNYNLINLDHEALEGAFRKTFYSAVNILEGVIPDMIKRHEGHVVSVCSIAALAPQPGLMAHSASMSALYAYMTALRQELKLKGSSVRTTIVHPCVTNIPMTGRFCTNTHCEPHEVADRILEAVLCEKEEILIPRRLLLFHSLLQLLPATVHDALVYYFFDYTKTFTRCYGYDNFHI